MRAECRKLLMMIGRMALSSKLPWLPAKATALSSPITWMQTITIASHWVGLTLPGMIDEPGSFSGSSSSPRPQRGPEASQRMSLAIFIKATASPRSAAMRGDHRVERALRGELVRRGHERVPGQLRDLGGDLPAEARRRVQPGADGGAAGRELEQTRLGRCGCARARRAAAARSPTIPARPSAARRPADACARS